MTCDEIRSQFLDRDFDLKSVEAAAQIAEHFRQCQACRQAAEQYDELRRRLSVSDGQLASTTFSETAELPLPGLVPAQAACSRKGADGTRSMPATFQPRVQGRMSWAVALAALLLLAASGWTLYLAHPGNRPGGVVQSRNSGERREPGARAPVEPVVPADLRWTPADVDRGVAVFTQVSQSFDGRAGWVAVGDRASDVGLIDGPSAPPPRVLLVRLLMSQGGQSPSKTDLVIVPGQEVSVELPFQAGEVLRYRLKTTTGANSRLTLAAEVRSLDRGETLAALATQLQPQPGQTLSAGRLLSQSGSYNLDVSFSETTLSAVQ